MSRNFAIDWQLLDKLDECATSDEEQLNEVERNGHEVDYSDTDDDDGEY